MGSNSQLAKDAASAAITLALELLIASQKWTLLHNTAEAENRDISDAELAMLRAENQKLTDDVLRKLE